MIELALEALGFAAVVVGVYLWLGLAAALIVGGVVLVAAVNAPRSPDARRP